MADDSEQIARLKSRLEWESGGPLGILSDQAVQAVLVRARAAADWLREMGEERPLISVLLALQIGFAIGRWGPRRAHR